MPYRIVDVELTEPMPSLELDADETGVALISRRDGRVVGFALHALDPGARLDAPRVATLLDPDCVPGEPEGTDRGADASGRPSPRITVAVCTRDRPELLAECLGSVLGLVPPPHEVVVVDNAPARDGTRRLVRDLAVRYFCEPTPGLDFARNRALRESTGDFVAFVDDDVVVDEHWLEGLRGALRHHPDAAAVTGQVLPFELTTPAQIAFERRGGFRRANETIRWSGPTHPGDPLYPYGAGNFGAGCNMTFRRDVALELGGFDEALDTGPPLPGGGDLDMLHRVVRAGRPLVYEPRAVVFHRHRLTDDALRRQYESWGRAFMAYVAKTYRDDPPGRRQLRRLVVWWFRWQLGALRAGASGRGDRAPRFVLAELQGGVVGLLGEYERSVRRTGRLRRTGERPTVALLPWGDVIEDYLEPIGVSLDEFVERMSGGWLFGYVDALRSAGVETIVVVWSARVDRPVRRVHAATGAAVWLLPSPPLYRLARSRLADPYAWDRRSAIGGASTSVLRRATGSVARVAAPYLSTSFRRLSEVLRREGCRVVLCQEYEEGRFDVCVLLGRLTSIPTFATFQGGDHTRTRLERLLRRRAIAAAAGFVVASDDEAERLAEQYGVPDSRIERIPNPLDVPDERPSRREARAMLGIEDSVRVVVWHGRVDARRKGLDVLLDCWAEIEATRSREEALLLLLGTGADAPWLRRRIDELGLTTVRWRDEYVLDRAVVDRHLAAADVFVLPSRHEGFPVALLEAMAAGLAVVATDAPGVRELLADRNGAPVGSIVPRGDPRALTVALRRLLDDPGGAADAGARARERARERFSLDAVGARLRDFLLGSSEQRPSEQRPSGNGPSEHRPSEQPEPAAGVQRR